MNPPVFGGAFHDIPPRFSGFGFHRKLIRTKTQQGTDKARKNNGCKVFLRVSTGSDVINFFFYHLSSLFILLPSHFLPNFPFSPPPPLLTEPAAVIINIKYVPLCRTLSKPPLLIPHPIRFLCWSFPSGRWETEPLFGANHFRSAGGGTLS